MKCVLKVKNQYKRPVGMLAPPFIIGFLVTEYFPKFQTLLKIIHLVYRKSFLVIICPNSHDKLTKIKIRSSWSRFEH